MLLSESHPPLFTRIELPAGISADRIECSHWSELGMTIKCGVTGEEIKKVSKTAEMFNFTDSPPLMEKKRTLCSLKSVGILFISPVLFAITAGTMVLVSPILIPLFTIHLLALTYLLFRNYAFNLMHVCQKHANLMRQNKVFKFRDFI